MAVTGERIADRYSLERPIGQGGMGVVWLAHDHLLDREVAIKEVTLPDSVPRQERDSLRARVLREARAAARLNHPSAITLYDVLNEHGRAFIVMELIKAGTLAEIVARDGPLAPEAVARIGLQVASALEAAHHAGIVHRDVKPANVMVAEDGRAWLADFGIARVQGDPKLTSTGLIVGSPAYMAPEQASGGESGPGADLWGLGATMYYAVEGGAPFEGGNSFAILNAVVNEPAARPRRAGALAPVILSLLAKDPQARPALRQVRIRLARIAGREAAATVRPAAVPVAPSRPPTPTEELFAPAAAPATPAAGAGEAAGAPPPPPPAAPPHAPAAPAAEVEAPAEQRPPEAEPQLEPEAAPVRPGGPGGRRRWLAALAVLSGVVAVVLVLVLLRPLGGGGASGRRETAPTRTTSAPATTRQERSGGPQTTAPRTTASTPESPSSSAPGAGAQQPPAGWTSLSNPSGGYRVAYPPGWSRSTGLARHGTAFREGTGRSIKVESAHPAMVPANGDPVAPWRQNEQYWSSRLPGYRLIGSVHAGTYNGMRAAVWEYTYTPNGRRLHGLDVSFVSPDRSWGYSVLYLIPEDRWGDSQDLVRSFERSFSPLG